MTEKPERAIDEALYAAYKSAKADRDIAEAEMAALRDKLIETMALTPDDVSLDLTVNGEKVGTFSRTPTTRVDTKRLKRDWPDIAAQYSTTTMTTRVALP